MLNVINHQGNENQNQKEISPYFRYNGYLKRQKIMSSDEYVEKENLLTFY